MDEIIELVKDEMATAVQTDNDNQIEDDSIPTNQSINHSLTHSINQSVRNRVTTFISFHREKCQKRHQKLFFLQKKIYFTMCYIFLRNTSKFQEKRFINNYLIMNY